MRHVEIAARASQREDLARRLTGRFYTPGGLARRLAAAALDAGARPRTLSDPFCGDGRLVHAFLEEAAARVPPILARLRRIVLWDHDGPAVEAAARRTRALLAALGLRGCRVEAWRGDTFERAGAAAGAHDLVLTNPPWELLKPDARDGVGSARSAYVASLRAYAARLAAAHPGAASARGKAMTGYGVNLARAGALASAALVARGGRLAIVLPASLFADQASAPFREAFLGALRVEAIDWFPAEARLFEGVDQPVLLCLGRAPGPTAALSLARHGPDQGLLERRVLRLESLAAPLPLAVGGEQAALAAGLAREHPPLSSLEEDARTGLWLGRELDETRIGEALAPAGRGVPFLKGRHVFPWELRPDPPLFVDPSLRRIPATVRERRLAWRDVSRPNQRRRMHAALLPPGAVTGNSLGVAFFRRGGRDRLPVLLAVVNSLAFELQVRASLATAHVSQGVLRRCAVPAPAFGAPRIAGRIRAAAAARLRARGERPEVEVAVARAYGLRREAFAALLEAFPKLGAVEREALLADELWRGAGW